MSPFLETDVLAVTGPRDDEPRDTGRRRTDVDVLRAERDLADAMHEEASRQRDECAATLATTRLELETAQALAQSLLGDAVRLEKQRDALLAALESLMPLVPATWSGCVRPGDWKGPGAERITNALAECQCVNHERLRTARTAIANASASTVTVDTGTGPYEAQVGTEPMPLPEPDCEACGGSGNLMDSGAPDHFHVICPDCGGTGKASR